jgi:hypothetical protein
VWHKRINPAGAGFIEYFVALSPKVTDAFSMVAKMPFDGKQPQKESNPKKMIIKVNEVN